MIDAGHIFLGVLSITSLGTALFFAKHKAASHADYLSDYAQSRLTSHTMHTGRAARFFQERSPLHSDLSHPDASVSPVKAQGAARGEPGQRQGATLTAADRKQVMTRALPGYVPPKACPFRGADGDPLLEASALKDAYYKAGGVGGHWIYYQEIYDFYLTCCRAHGLSEAAVMRWEPIGQALYGELGVERARRGGPDRVTCYNFPPRGAQAAPVPSEQICDVRAKARAA